MTRLSPRPCYGFVSIGGPVPTDGPPHRVTGQVTRMGTSIRGSRRWRQVIVPRIIRRDNGICHICGQPGADTADHIIPVADGGTDHETNLAAAHHIPCNVRRGNRPLDTIRTELAHETGATSAWSW